jgi:ribonuclease-3
MTTDDPTQLQAALAYEFRNPNLLRQALTHSSLAHELTMQAAESSPNGQSAMEKEPRDNENLEFLGDSVLGLVTSQLLFERFPDFHEGRLSKMRAHLVSAKHLVRVARTLQLGRYLLLGRGEEHSGGRSKPALLADTLEALIAAIYLDGGLEPARKVIIEAVLQPEINRLAATDNFDENFTDFKSALQEWLQSKGMAQPVYAVVNEAGPEHRKMFTMEVRIHEHGSQEPLYVAKAEDSTKKKAEQLAARMAMEHLRAQETPVATPA